MFYLYSSSAIENIRLAKAEQKLFKIIYSVNLSYLLYGHIYTLGLHHEVSSIQCPNILEIIIPIIKYILQLLELDLFPDHKKGPDRSYPYYILDTNPVLMHDLSLEVLTVNSNELRLFWAKAFPLSVILLSRIWHRSSKYNF